MMRKYGKFEQKPEAATAKQPKVKNTLLQTYLTSLLGMVLCVAMFLGTSYAWFTSEVTNVGNEIYIGTLDVGLYKEADPEDLDLADANYRLLNKDIRWEPGYTAIETIHVINEGELAFNYVLNFTDGALEADSVLSRADVAENFDVWVYNDENNTIPAPTAYTDINENNGWRHAGTLEDLLAGKAVLQGDMAAQILNPEDGSVTNPQETHTYTIALHMKEETDDNNLMGEKITLNVKLVAYQKSAENDGFQNGNYDDIHVAPSAPLLQDALNGGGVIMLSNDILIEKLDGRVSMNGGLLDGDGKAITYTGGRNEKDGSVGVLTTKGGTIKNLTINGSDAGRALYMTEVTSDLVVTDCTLSGTYSFNLNSAAVSAYSMFFTNTTFDGWASYADVVRHAYFTDCSFLNTLKPYADTTLTDCTFTAESLNVSGLAADKTITLENCTYKDVVIDHAVLTAVADAEGNVTVTCDNALLTIADGYVVLNTTNP